MAGRQGCELLWGQLGAEIPVTMQGDLMVVTKVLDGLGGVKVRTCHQVVLYAPKKDLNLQFCILSYFDS